MSPVPASPSALAPPADPDAVDAPVPPDDSPGTPPPSVARAGHAASVSPPPRRRGPVRLTTPALRETSGLAVSRRDPDVLWAINDGGHAPALHALARDGRALGSWPVEAANRDWEDLAAFRLGGEPYLLIADTGDNGRRRDEVVLHLVAEPVVTGPGAVPGTPLAPARSLVFRYEDGAHDVESVAVDETTGTVWLLPKTAVRNGRGVAGGVYALSLVETEALDGRAPPLLARRRTTLADVPRGLLGALATSLAGVDLEQPTALDMSADGRRACLLTYRRLRCFERGDGEGWDETFARAGRVLPSHDLDQAEALAITPDGAVAWFTSEGVRPPLRRRALRW